MTENITYLHMQVVKIDVFGTFFWMEAVQKYHHTRDSGTYHITQLHHLLVGDEW